MKMRNAILLTFIITACVVAAFLPSREATWAIGNGEYSIEDFSRDGDTYVWKETITVPAASLDSAEIHTVNGFIKASSEGSEPAGSVVIEAVIKIKAGAFCSEETLLKTKSFVGISQEEKDGRIIVRGKQPNRKPWSINSIAIDMQVKSPDNLALDLHTVNGPVSVDGMKSRLQVHTVNGPVDSRRSSGPFEVRTVNGRIRLQDVSREVKAETVNGGIDSLFIGMPEKACQFKTVNGGIKVDFPDDAGIDLELGTVNGGLHFDRDAFDGSAERKHVQGQLRQGGSLVQANTVNGSIHIQ